VQTEEIYVTKAIQQICFVKRPCDIHLSCHTVGWDHAISNSAEQHAIQFWQKHWNISDGSTSRKCPLTPQDGISSHCNNSSLRLTPIHLFAISFCQITHYHIYVQSSANILQYAGPADWNSVPHKLQAVAAFTIFKKLLKTHLFI